LLVYWLLLAALSLGTLIYQRRYRLDGDHNLAIDDQLRNNLGFAAILVAITLLIGFRYRVGGDWNVYKFWFGEIGRLPFRLALKRSPDEWGYTILNWVVARLGVQLWLVNLVCALPFMAGLAALCRDQPNPWLALLVATPLLVIVVGMGYTRQATALGFMLIGLVGISRGRAFWWFVVWTLVGSLFHESVLLFIPVVPLFLLRLSGFSLLLLAAAAAFGYLFVLPHTVEHYSRGYINQVYLAKGAIYRIAPNTITALIPLLFRRRFEGSRTELKIWRGFAYCALLIQIAYFEIASTVILDRISAYVLPLQVWVWSRLPTAFGQNRQPSLAVTALVIGYSALVLGLWLMFATHSRYWIPYRVYPLS